MLYCPNCKAVYENDATACPVCGEKLVSAPQADYIDDGEAFLISVDAGFDADLVEGALRSADIPFVKKGHGGPAGFARFDTKYDSLGADFYVPSRLLERARLTLPPVEGATSLKGHKPPRAFAAPEDPNSDKAVVPEPEQNPAKRALLVLLVLVLAALAVFGTDAVMDIFRAAIGYK